MWRHKADIEKPLATIEVMIRIENACGNGQPARIKGKQIDISSHVVESRALGIGENRLHTWLSLYTSFKLMKMTLY
jgi:hypothetical protein